MKKDLVPQLNRMNILVNDTPESSIPNFHISKNLNYIESSSVTIAQVNQNPSRVHNLPDSLPLGKRHTMAPDMLNRQILCSPKKQPLSKLTSKKERQIQNSKKEPAPKAQQMKPAEIPSLCVKGKLNTRKGRKDSVVPPAIL